MPRGAEEATRRFLGALQRAISCVAPAVIIRRPASADEPRSFTFRERFVPLQAQPALELSFLHFYDVVPSAVLPGTEEVRTTGYFYQLHERGGAEVIALLAPPPA